MGHERVGYLPKTKKWASIVEDIISFSESNNNVAEISRQTTKNVRSRFRNIESDNSVQAAFEFLVHLSVLPVQNNWQAYLQAYDIQIHESFSILELAQAAKKYVHKDEQSKEYATFASQALIDAISSWVTKNKGQQASFFESNDKPMELWRRVGSGDGFCEISRVFFSKFTERYLKYFLERETVLRITDISDLSAFNSSLEQHLDDISRHAFETSKITQSFAAGWYNKNVVGTPPSKKKIRGFLSVAFGKLNSELLREDNR